MKKTIIKKMSGGGGNSITISLNGIFTVVLVLGFVVVGYFALVGWKSAIITKWNSFFEKRRKAAVDDDDSSSSGSESEEEADIKRKKKIHNRRK
jgi:hypothetical protein